MCRSWYGSGSDSSGNSLRLSWRLRSNRPLVRNRCGFDRPPSARNFDGRGFRLRLYLRARARSILLPRLGSHTGHRRRLQCVRTGRHRGCTRRGLRSSREQTVDAQGRQRQRGEDFTAGGRVGASARWRFNLKQRRRSARTGRRRTGCCGCAEVRQSRLAPAERRSKHLAEAV